MEESIFKITKDPERAKDLLIMAKERLNLIKIIPKEVTYKIIEEYYEIIVELITAIMYSEGYKTLDHKSLIEFISKDLEESETQLIDILRKNRHGIVYYGKKINKEFLINNEGEIKKLINKLILILNKKNDG